MTYNIQSIKDGIIITHYAFTNKVVAEKKVDRMCQTGGIGYYWIKANVA